MTSVRPPSLPRVSIRTLMMLVLVLALGLGLALPAWTVAREKDEHIHSHIRMVGDKPSIIYKLKIRPPFWSKLALCISGQPWRSRPICGAGEGLLEEACAIAHPEILPDEPGDPLGRTAEQEAAYFLLRSLRTARIMSGRTDRTE